MTDPTKDDNAAKLKTEIRLLEAALARKEVEILVMETELAKQKERRRIDRAKNNTPETKP